MDIPKNWTFKSASVAEGFDNHVREQLPWYDICTRAVVHIARHYIPKNGLVYDIGASTGNISRHLAPDLIERQATIVSIEESQDMVKLFAGHGDITCADACDYPYERFDFACLFLVLMFVPIYKRKRLLERLYSRLNAGGAIVVLDKINPESGYAWTVMRRMALSWKIDSGTPHADILAKELSLAGYQRPITEDILPSGAIKFFQLSDFCGWIIEKKEE